MSIIASTSSRRSVLKAGALVSIGVLGGSYGFVRARTPAVLLSGATDKQQNHFAVVMNGTGDIITQVLLPARSHAAVFNSVKNEALFFSRRPGNELYVINASTNRMETIIHANVGRHFYGHGILTPDGKYLLATENDFEAGVGKITIRDANKNYSVVKEIPSFGVGPHELSFMPNSNLIVVANGGLRTHPDKNRLPQNVQTMRPNVSFIDWQSGHLLAQYEPDNLKMGLRHLHVKANGDVIIGVQYKGSVLDNVPLVLKASLHSGIMALNTSSNFAYKNKQYTASVCNTNNSTWVSCPKSHTLTCWNSHSLVGSCKIKDVAGIAYLKESHTLMVSNGSGAIGSVSNENGRIQFKAVRQHSGLRWDNHLIAVI